MVGDGRETHNEVAELQGQAPTQQWGAGRLLHLPCPTDRGVGNSFPMFLPSLLPYRALPILSQEHYR